MDYKLDSDVRSIKNGILLFIGQHKSVSYHPSGADIFAINVSLGYVLLLHHSISDSEESDVA